MSYILKETVVKQIEKSVENLKIQFENIHSNKSFDINEVYTSVQNVLESFKQELNGSEEVIQPSDEFIEEFSSIHNVDKDNLKQLVQNNVIPNVKMVYISKIDESEITNIKNTLEKMSLSETEILHSFLNEHYETLKQKYSEEAIQFLQKATVEYVFVAENEIAEDWFIRKYYVDINYDDNLYEFHFCPKDAETQCNSNGGKEITGKLLSDLEQIFFDSDLFH